MSELINRIIKLAETVKRAAGRDVIVCPYYKSGQQVQVNFSDGHVSPCMGGSYKNIATGNIEFGDACPNRVDDNPVIEWGKSGDFDKDRNFKHFQCKKMGDVALTGNVPVPQTVNTNVSDNQPQGQQQPGGQI
jgi:hypothetical protein